MNIKDAIIEANKSTGHIARGGWRSKELFIKPTNTDKCCIFYKKGKPFANRWNPKAEDLIANDWIVVD